MAETVTTPFDKRLRRVVRRHNRLVDGVRHKVTKDGLIVAKPRLYRPRFPLKGLLMIAAVAFLFKGYVYADLGARDYNSRVAAMQTGTLAEQFGGWLMQADPATVILGDVFREVMR